MNKVTVPGLIANLDIIALPIPCHWVMIKFALSYDLSDLENQLCEWVPRKTNIFLYLPHSWMLLQIFVTRGQCCTVWNKYQFIGTDFSFNSWASRPQDKWSYLFYPSSSYPIIVLEGAQIMLLECLYSAFIFERQFCWLSLPPALTGFRWEVSY